MDEETDRCISRCAHNMPKAPGVGGRPLHQRINNESNPSIILSNSSFQNKKNP